MAIEDHYDRTIDTERLFDDSGGGTETYDTYLTGVACTIQPLDESFGEDLTGSFGKDFLMFCAVQDILEGDKVIEDSTEYKVVGVESYAFLGQDRHMEVRIRKQNP